MPVALTMMHIHHAMAVGLIVSAGQSITNEEHMSDSPDSKKTTRIKGAEVISTARDGSVTVSSTKPMTVDVGSIRSVGIENLMDVQEHVISRIVGSTSHFIKFFDGGELRFAYNDKGALLDLQAEQVLTSIQGGRIMVRQKAGNS